MNVLNKLRTTVSGALPGNPLIREYDILRPSGSAGPGLLWKLYSGNKKSTKQEVTLWIMEKKSLDVYNRHDKEFVLDMLRRGVSNLTRLRHPRVLSVLAPLDESRESLAFVTEPVVASLHNLVSGPNGEVCLESPDEVEIRYGIYQLNEALAFLHNDGKQIHGGLCAEAILVTSAGAWKLAGFDHSMSSSAMKTSSNGEEPVFTVPEWQANLPYVGQPRLDYVSPEAALQGRAGPSSDIFALAMLIIYLYGHGKPLYECRNELSIYKRNIRELKGLSLNVLERIPEILREYVKLMLNPEPSLRPDAHQFSKIPFFDDASTRTLQSLDNLFQLDNLAKSQFYKQLPNSLKVLPKRILLMRVYQQLSEDFVNPNMVPFVLPAVLQIVEATTEHEFREQILPKLLTIFALTEPIHVALICMQNLPILLSKCPSEELKNHVIPMVTRSIDSSNPLLQEICLSVLPTVAHMMDYSILKNSVVSKVKKLCMRTSDNEMRVKCLLSIGKLMEHMDKWYVLDEVLPMLPDLRTRDPSLVMAILGIYRVAFSHKKLGITKEILATKVIPQLIPLCIDSNLSLPQFSAIMCLVKEMIAKVEDEQKGKLQQLHNIQEEQRSLMNSTGLSNAGESKHNDRPLKAIGSSEGKPNSMIEQFMLGLSPDSVNASLAGPLFDASNAIGFSDELENSSGTATSLSIEAKQRLALKAEQANKMNKVVNSGRGRIAPVNAPPSRRALPAPKDLTSSLMEHNLASMTLQSAGQQLGMGSVAGQQLAIQAPPVCTSTHSQMDMSSLDNLFGPGPGPGPGLGRGRAPTMNEIRAITYPNSSLRPQSAWPSQQPGLGQPMAVPIQQFPRMQQQQQQPSTTLNKQDINDLLG